MPSDTPKATTLAALRRQWIREFEDAAEKAGRWAATQEEEGLPDMAARTRESVVRARAIADALRDAERLRALRPYLSVGETEDGDAWGLWCVAKTQREAENVHALYARGFANDAEEQKSENGDPQWGPGVEAMLDEMAARLAPDGREA